MEIYRDLFPMGEVLDGAQPALIGWASSTCVTWWDPVAPALCSQWHFPRVNDKLPTSLYALIQHIQGKTCGKSRMKPFLESAPYWFLVVDGELWP